jgi:transcriptional regulator with XRE-family HTH domain
MATQTAGTAIPVWSVTDRLVKAREFASMTQQDIADALHVGKRSITRYESRDNPPRAIILAYSAVTGVPVWWIEGTDPGEPSTERVTREYPQPISILPALFAA